MLYKVMLSPAEISSQEAIHEDWSLLVRREVSMLSFPLSQKEKEKCRWKLLLLGAATEISAGTPDLMWTLYWHDPKEATRILLEGLKRRLTLPLADPEKYQRHLKELQESECTIEEDLMSQDYSLNQAFRHAALLQKRERSVASGAESARLIAHFLSESMRAFSLEGDLLRDLLKKSLTTGGLDAILTCADPCGG